MKARHILIAVTLVLIAGTMSAHAQGVHPFTVSQGGVDIPDDGSFSFTATQAGNPETVTFTITNKFDAAYPLSSITVTGHDASSFTVTPPSSMTLPALGTLNFQVTFDPQRAPDTHTAVLVITYPAAPLAANKEGGPPDIISNLTYDFNLNGPAINTPPWISRVPNQVINEDTKTDTIWFQIGDVDKSAYNLSVYARSTDKDVIPDDNIELFENGDWRAMVITPAPDQNGNILIELYVDDASASTYILFRVNVLPVNDAPTITDIPDQTIPEDGSAGPVAFTIGDIDNDIADLVVTGSSDNSALIPAGNIMFGTVPGAVRGDEIPLATAGRTVTITPAANQFGTANVVVTVSDGTDSTSDTVVVTVTPVNDAPDVAGIPDISFDEDSTASIDLDGYVTDVDNDTTEMTWTVADLDTVPTLAKNAVMVTLGIEVTAVIDPTTHVATFTAVENYNGAGGTFVFTATDPGGLSDQDTSVVTIDPVNDPPRFVAPLPPVTLVQGDSVGIPLVLLYPLVEDVETPDSLLTWSIESHPHLVPEITADSVKIVAPLTYAGTDTLTVTVSDGSLTDTADLIVTVTPTGASPDLTSTGMDGHGNNPTKFNLDQNYPNPFNPSTTITYGIPTQTHVQIVVYNMTGQVIKTLVDGTVDSGYHTVQWDAAGVPSGIYFYSIQTPEFTQVRKCMLMK